MNYLEREKIDREVRKIKDYFSITNKNNINEIVEAIGGKIELVDSCIDEGVKATEGTFIIFVNEKDERRIKFRALQYLGFIFMYSLYYQDKDKWMEIQEYSKEKKRIKFSSWLCSEEGIRYFNEFAYSFLMPIEEFREVVMRNCNNGEVDTPKVAEYFDVNVGSTSYRGQCLGLFEW